MTRISKRTAIDFANLNYLSESPYDHTKWNLGRGIIANNGISAVDKYIAPDFGVIRPLEGSTPFAAGQIFAHNHSTNIAYLFGIENVATASNTRRIALWEVSRKTSAISWRGFITMTLASATAHTVRNFSMDVKQESTGTVAVSGTAVTGTGTLFNTNKVAIGARIGFGSTDPSQITTWYRITAKASDTGATINLSAGTVAGGTPYVIQEFRPIYTATNATLTNGGTHYGKGISIEDFTSGGTTIGLATTVDDQKAMYWLRDAATLTNTVACGGARHVSSANPTQLFYDVMDLPVGGQVRVFRYNLRAPLTVASGASQSAFVLVTGNQVVTGTVSQNANLAIANAQHGLGNGVLSLYFVTTTRVYRANTANITSGNVTWISDNITEIPPGGTGTFALTSALSTIEYMDSIDAFIVGTTHATSNFSYITKYVASGTQFEYMFGRDFKYLEHGAKDNGHPSIFSNQITPMAFSDAGANRLYAVKQGTTAQTNHIYVLPFGCDWNYAGSTNGRLITPAISAPNATKFYEAFVNNVRYLGDTRLGKPTEPFRVFTRTTNITTDATSGWTLIDETNDISGLGGTLIQFAIEFRTIGESCLPSRILAVNMSYEDDNMLDNFALSEEKSSSSSKIIAFYFKTAFGGTVPTLRINIVDVNTGGLLLTDTTTASANGVWEKTTDGTTWTAYNSTDRANNTTYIRYTPTSIADNIRVSPRIVLA